MNNVVLMQIVLKANRKSNETYAYLLNWPETRQIPKHLIAFDTKACRAILKGKSRRTTKETDWTKIAPAPQQHNNTNNVENCTIASGAWVSVAVADCCFCLDEQRFILWQKNQFRELFHLLLLFIFHRRHSVLLARFNTFLKSTG